MPECYRLIADVPEYLAGRITGMAETWMLDELAHAGPEHLDAAFIAGYDKKQGYPDPGEDLAAFEARGSAGHPPWSTSAPAPGSSRSPRRGGSGASPPPLSRPSCGAPCGTT